jgi:1-deoxy-D-xylulose-5-phosphate synthase
LVGADGPTHHGTFDLSYLRYIPGITIMAPKDEAELRNMLFTASNQNGGPIVIRYPRGSALGVEVKDEFENLTIGKAEKLNEGNDVAILAIGSMVDYSISALKILSENGINASLFNMRFVKPLDGELLNNIAKNFKKIVTVEENSLIGGFGTGVLEYLSDNNFKNDVLRLGIPDKFIDHGTQVELHKILEIDVDGIVNKITQFVKQ